MNHKWNEYDECVKCKCYREKETVKTLMAIHSGKDIYKYEVKYRYFTVHNSGLLSKGTLERPNCYLTTYDE